VAQRVPALHPVARRARATLHVADHASVEWGFAREAYQILRELDLLVISGGGPIDDTWGGPWRQPFTLARWIGLGRLAGARVVVLSVGATPLRHRLSRAFVRMGLGVASYRSFRDAESRCLALSVGARVTDPVVPDLAYAVPAPPRRRPGDSGIVVVSPMAFLDPRSWPDKDPRAYAEYVECLAVITSWLVTRGYRIELFGTDIHMDGKTVRDVLTVLGKAARGHADASRTGMVTSPPVTTTAEVLGRFAGADYVIASRYHSALLAHVVGTPVLALSHHHKVRTLMVDSGQEDYCLGLTGVDVEEVKARFTALERSRGREVGIIRRYATACRDRVERQFSEVFGT
jgi:polysaccharide pyruvyl transferase WcaK-like protein